MGVSPSGRTFVCLTMTCPWISLEAVRRKQGREEEARRREGGGREERREKV